VTELKTSPDLTQADVERILGIVDRLNDIEVRLEIDGMKLHVRKFSAAVLAIAAPASMPVAAPARAAAAAAMQSPAPAASQAATVPEAQAAASSQGLIEIRAPMLGRFFGAPSPSEPAYVEVGSKVEPDDTVCMVEVMKLFNTVKAGVSGTIVEVLIDNGVMVEHDAVLFRVKPQ